MATLVTGATGFIGRHVLERLLQREGDIFVLVREGSTGKLDALAKRLGSPHRIRPVRGDLAKPMLGVSDAWIAKRKGEIDHVFHLAAIYDMTADAEANRVANVDGTRNAVTLANALEAGCFHHVSSIAAAGAFRGTFTEEMFDEGQSLEHPYHATKFESEKIARTMTRIPWRVYRPAIVVGHSKTGEMDKIDGPYYFFKLLRMMRSLPSALRIPFPSMGATNVVPVDFVAAAMDHLAHEPDLDGRAFHLVNPTPQRSVDVFNVFAAAAGTPQLLAVMPKEVLKAWVRLGALGGMTRSLRALAGIPEDVLDHLDLVPAFDATETMRALEGTGIEVPPLAECAPTLWSYWEQNLDPDRSDQVIDLRTMTKGAASTALRRGGVTTIGRRGATRALLGRGISTILGRDATFEEVVEGKTVVITGASSGIGKAAAHKVAQAGGIPILVARGFDKLEETRIQIEASGGKAWAYRCDLSDTAAIEALAKRLLEEHDSIDIVVNNAGRSIRRSVELSYDRFHDFERTVQLNYLGAIKLIMGVLPQMRERKSGHIINISSIGVQTNPPRFSAYVASKAALDAFTRVVASECIGDDVHFTTIHMPLVRTPMIAPTGIYKSFPTISPEEAADLICEAIRSKPKRIDTRLGTAGEVLYALVPRAVDRVLHVAYQAFPDSAAARGRGEGEEQASTRQVALAHLFRGIHW